MAEQPAVTIADLYNEYGYIVCPSGRYYLRDFHTLQEAWESPTASGQQLVYYAAFYYPRLPTLWHALDECGRELDRYGIHSAHHAELALSPNARKHSRAETVWLWMHTAINFHPDFHQHSAYRIRQWIPNPPKPRRPHDRTD